MKSSRVEPVVVKRLPYEKPELRSISLVADQVLGVNCKTATQNLTAKVGDPLMGCYYINYCRTLVGS